MQRDAGACADLIAEDEAREKLRPAALGAAVDCSEQRRQYRDTGVSFGEDMAVVRVERVDHRCAGERGAGAARAATVEEEPRFGVAARHLRCRVRIGDRCCRHPCAGRSDADQVEEAAPALPDDIRRDRVERPRAHERRDVDDVRRCRGRRNGGTHDVTVSP